MKKILVLFLALFVVVPPSFAYDDRFTALDPGMEYGYADTPPFSGRSDETIGESIRRRLLERRIKLRYEFVTHAAKGQITAMKAMYFTGGVAQAMAYDQSTVTKALLVAVTNNQLATVKYLLSKGASVNHGISARFWGEEYSYTPLCEALLHQHRDMTSYLLSKGASITSFKDEEAANGNKEYKGPRTGTVMCNVGDTYAYYMRVNTDYPLDTGYPLYLAVELGWPEVVQQMLRHGASFGDLPNKYLPSLLRFNAIKGRYEMVALLCKKINYTPETIQGAYDSLVDHINQERRGRATPHMVKTLKLLLSHGARISRVPTQLPISALTSR